MTLANDLWKLATEAGRDLLHRTRDGWTTRDTISTAQDVENIERVRRGRDARRAAAVVRAGGSVMFVKQMAKICGRAGAAGAAVDGAIGGVQAAKYVQRGVIDKEQAVKHVGAEAGCGFVTSSSGTAGTLAVFMFTGSMGPAALVAGMGASMGSRYLYKEAVGETLPSEEELEQMYREQNEADGEAPAEDAPGGGTPDLEDIGPGGAPDLEEIGPDGAPDPEETKPSADADDADADEASAEGDGGASTSEDSDADDGPNGADDVWESIGPDDG